MKMKKNLLALALALSAAAPLSAAAKEINGMNVPDEVVLDGKTLHLNGVGIRKKFIIKVYVGALYLEAPATGLDQITSADQTRVIHMQFVRSVEKEKIVGAWKEGIEKNSKDKAATLLPQIDKVAEVMTNVESGQVMTVTYSPGKGTTVAIQGGKTVTIEGKEFGDAILRNWLGPKPADDTLKEAMLSGGK